MLATNLHQRPSLRPSVLALQQDDIVKFICTSTSTVKSFVADDFVHRMVTLLDGTNTLSEIHLRLCDSEGYTPERVDDVLAILGAESLLQGCAVAGESADLTVEELARYDRQLLLLQDLSDGEASGLSGSGQQLQARLRQATVTVVGAGGVGSWVLASLAAAGIGTLRVCDFDTIETSNLNRQILFSASDVGKPKLDVITDWIRQFNPAVKVEPVLGPLTAETRPGALADNADIVLGCADQPSVVTVADWLADACHPYGTPHIVGGSYAYQTGALGMSVLPGRTACWSCARAETATDLGRDRSRPLLGHRGAGASLAPFSAVVANVLAWETLRILLGLPPLLADRWGELDFWRLHLQWRPIPRRPGCPRCG